MEEATQATIEDLIIHNQELTILITQNQKW